MVCCSKPCGSYLFPSSCCPTLFLSERIFGGLAKITELSGLAACYQYCWYASSHGFGFTSEMHQIHLQASRQAMPAKEISISLFFLYEQQINIIKHRELWCSFFPSFVQFKYIILLIQYTYFITYLRLQRGFVLLLCFDVFLMWSDYFSMTSFRLAAAAIFGQDFRTATSIVIERGIYTVYIL